MAKEKNKLRDYLETMAIVFFLPALLILVAMLLLLFSEYHVLRANAGLIGSSITGFACIAGLAVWLCYTADANSKDEIMFAFTGVMIFLAGVLAVVVHSGFWWTTLVAFPFLVTGIFFRIDENRNRARQSS